MKLHQQTITIATAKKSFTDITRDIAECVANAKVDNGLCNVFIQHTSASLVIQENADPAVLRDLERWMRELVPESRDWEHSAEGPDDMPAHVRSVLTKTSESIPIVSGRLALGTWQGLYLWEHRAHRHQRRLTVSIIGQ